MITTDSKATDSTQSRFGRRAFLTGLAATAGCATVQIGAPVPHTHGSVQGYKGLANTPWFDLNAAGQPVLKRALWEELPWGVDFHTHLGLSLMFTPVMDYQKLYPRTRYLIDCDHPVCDYQFDDYLNKIGTPEHLRNMDKALLTQVFGGGEVVATHTIPDLRREMNQMHMARAVLLAVAPRLPFRSNPTEAWFEALASSPYKERFIMFAGVDVRDAGAIGQLKKYVKMGARGVKLHPTMQQFFPDEKAAMALYEVCEQLGIPVFFHAGRAGIEPKYTRQFAEMHHYIAPVREFPNLTFIFGHAGARDWREALDIAAKYKNVYLEIEGQGVTELQTMLGRIGSERLLFGSDWPFYPEAATMARVLMATEDDKIARDRILAFNARRLLKI